MCVCLSISSKEQNQNQRVDFPGVIFLIKEQCAHCYSHLNGNGLPGTVVTSPVDGGVQTAAGYSLVTNDFEY